MPGTVAATSVAWLGWIALLAAVYWVAPPRLRPAWLAANCLAFLLATSPLSALVVLAMGATAWFGGAQRRHRGLATAAVCGGIVAVLASFKVAAQGTVPGTAQQVALPLGLSYYSFRCIHYLLERYKGTLPPHRPGEFAAYLLFLPTFAAGPIHRFPEFHRDFVAARLDPALVARGLERIVYGYAKIVVLANFAVAALLVPFGESLEATSPWRAEYVATVAQGLNAYLQFAGYSDIAIGASLLLGFRVLENFNAPFFASNISEFWRRWHISLNSWCRDYVYTTIVSLYRRPALAALVTMLVVGLWHELSARYVLWGLWHGVGLAAWQVWQAERRRRAGGSLPPPRPAGRVLGFLLTFHYVMLSFALLGEGTLRDAFARLGLLLTGVPPA